MITLHRLICELCLRLSQKFQNSPMLVTVIVKLVRINRVTKNFNKQTVLFRVFCSETSAGIFLEGKVIGILSLM